jgi:hypothetical protein
LVLARFSVMDPGVQPISRKVNHDPRALTRRTVNPVANSDLAGKTGGVIVREFRESDTDPVLALRRPAFGGHRVRGGGGPPHGWRAHGAGAIYAIDSFPDQRCSPLTDHAAFIDVMSDRLQAQVAACVNDGRQRQP